MVQLKNKINSILLRIFNAVQYPLMEVVFCRNRLNTYCFCNRYFGHTKRNNLGDDLNIDFLENLFGKRIIKKEFSLFNKGKTYSFIGSILEYVCNRKESVFVWGSGFKFANNNLKDEDIKKNTYLAVRGPLTRNIILKAGGSCPDIYGDPGILLSRYIKVDRNIKYKYGLIPHKTEFNSESVTRINQDKDVLLIDIVNYGSWKEFLEKVNSCEYILSSSLHGIIIADSYLIPNIWVRFTSNIDGGGFKYLDYFEGVKKNTHCVDLSYVVDFKVVDSELSKWTPPVIDESFIKSCPFKI